MAKQTISRDEYNHFVSHDERGQDALLERWGLQRPVSVKFGGDTATFDDGRKEPEPTPPDQAEGKGGAK